MTDLSLTAVRAILTNIPSYLTVDGAIYGGFPTIFLGQTSSEAWEAIMIQPTAETKGLRLSLTYCKIYLLKGPVIVAVNQKRRVLDTYNLYAQQKKILESAKLFLPVAPADFIGHDYTFRTSNNQAFVPINNYKIIFAIIDNTLAFIVSEFNRKKGSKLEGVPFPSFEEAVEFVKSLPEIDEDDDDD